MKKALFILVIAAFFAGCGTMAERSEFYDHDSMYRNFDHLKFSWYGYKSPTMSDSKNSDNQNWWGIPVDVNQK